MPETWSVPPRVMVDATDARELPRLGQVVPATQRGPIGGILDMEYVGATTAALPTGTQHIRLTLNGGDATINPPASNLQPGQQVLIEAIAANGTPQQLTFSSSFETPAVLGRSFRIPATQRVYIRLIARGSIMRILSVDPPLPPLSIPITYAATITPDGSAGSTFYVVATGNVVVADPVLMTDGQRLLVEVNASGATRTAGISGNTTNASGVTLPLSIASTKVGFLGFVYSARAGHPVLIAATAEP